MKKFLFKNGLYGLFLSLIAVFVLGNTSFATDFGDIQKYTKVKIIQDNGEFGLARVKFMGKTGREFKKMLESQAVDSSKTIDVYAAYTSYKANTNPLQNTYWPWVFPNQAFLFVAFKANASNQQVTITWRLFDWKPGWSTTPHNEVSWNYDNTTLSRTGGILPGTNRRPRSFLMDTGGAVLLSRPVVGVLMRMTAGLGCSTSPKSIA
ncbi:MAG: hypothetical protein ACK4WF_09825 [Candidatus Brocadiales bacterium]